MENIRFGEIRIGGHVYDHDVVIRLGGEVRKRKKKLSKQRYGTSHKVSVAEAEGVYDEGAERLIVGAGQYGALSLSDEARGFFEAKGCAVDVLPTPDAAKAWNEAEGKVIALIHVTC